MRSFFIWLALVPSVWAFPEGDFALQADASSIRYLVTHKLHKVVGVSNQIEGRALLKGGEGEAMIRVPAGSFDSGNGNRDVHVKEVLEVHKYPYVVLRAKLKKVSDDLARLNGTLEFHGQEGAVDIEIPLQKTDNGIEAKFEFSIKLSAYKIERPSLLFIQVDDEMKVQGNFLFKSSDQGR